MNLLTLFFLCFPLHAQDSQLESIKIESNKETRTIEQMTESVSVVPSNELDSPLQKDNIEVVNALPNISINKLDGSFSIRGINNTGVTGFAKDNVSSVLMDDIFLTDLAIKAGAFDVWDINHIEVYRGSQSTSQGINSLAGSILLFKNRATENAEGAFKLGTGNFGRFETGLMYNNSVLDKKLRYRLSYNREQSDGYTTNLTTGNDKWGKRQKDHLNLDLQYQINETDYVRFNTKYAQTDNGGIYVQGAEPFKYEVQEDVDFKSKTDHYQHSLRYFKQLKDTLSNETILAYSEASNKDTSDADWTSSPHLGTRQETHTDTYVSAENLLKFKNENTQNTFGIHTHRFNLKDYDSMRLFYGVPLGVVQTSDKTRTVLAAFNSFTRTFALQHHLTLGLRFEHVINDFQMDLLAPPVRSTSLEATSFNNVLLPKVAYTYTHEMHSYGFSLSEGYRTGGVSINRWQGTSNQYDPEKTTNYELSYKYQDSQLQLATNIFYTDWKEQQVLVEQSTMPFDTLVQNVARSQIYGAEGEARYQITPSQNLALGLGYARTEFQNFQSGGTDYHGHEFPFAPQWTGRIFHTLQITDNWSTASILRYIGSSYMNAENTRQAPEQFYLDVSSQYFWTRQNLIFDFFVKNILNQKYELIRSNPYSWNGSDPGVTNRQVSAPTEFGLRVTYMW